MTDPIDLRSELRTLARELSPAAERSTQEQQWEAEERAWRDAIRAWVDGLAGLMGSKGAAIDWLMERVPWPADEDLRYPPSWMYPDAHKRLSQQELEKEIWIHDVHQWIGRQARRGITPEQAVREGAHEHSQ